MDTGISCAFGNASTLNICAADDATAYSNAAARAPTTRRLPMARTTLTLNGQRLTVDVAPDTPLLWIIRDNAGLTGTKFGCGIGQCGACTVHVGGVAMRSCQLRISDVGAKAITTIEALSPDPAVPSHPVQKAWIEEQVPQCGYCQSGQIMAATALLAKTPHPTVEQINDEMSGNICRCGTYQRIRRAIQRAAGGGIGHH